MTISKKLASRVELIVFDFDGVFTDNRVLVMQDGTEAVFCSRADGFGLDAARGSGLKLLVLSKERNPVVGARCKKLKLDFLQGCDDKPSVLKAEAERLGIRLENVAYMGNDINDIGCMKLVGLPVAVADAYPEVKAISAYITTADGGRGAVREFCDLMAGLRRNG
jgi:YrbI family 3-deoxy-D-manno-octulosonate 8-phosphate phosphatase